MASIQDYEEIQISELKKYANNSKKHPQKQIELIMKSIQEFGFLTPCLIDQDKNLIAGHGRVQAAEKLGLKKVPCAKIEGLDENQRKAYIIADNKLTELGGWDKDLVAAELSLLDSFNFDIDVTGFNIQDVNEILYKPEKEYGAERDRTIDAYNMDLLHDTELTNDYWQMPVIENDNYIPKKMIGFNYAKTSKEKNCFIHFYLDDYQFERIWNNPEKYLEILTEYEGILSPDFSLYMDMPMPMKIWNIYRSRQIGAFYQSYGLRVIPTISWAEKETFDFCFQGIPEGSIVSVSTIGVKEKDSAFNVWTEGMKAMIDKIKPKTILVYGGKLDFEYGDIEVIYFENQVLKNWKDKK